MIRERVNAGLDRARAAGKSLGRAKLATSIEQAISVRLAAGMGMLKIAREMNIGTSVVQRVKAEAARA